ncbi:MAG: hypothetical protein HQL26_06680 [Candidatus Omnitrophica bacterium]|nr:hypothetical protein [Candidatus Omnitrophota bacterium]
MWLKWLPWRYLIRSAARKHGFLDPIKILAQLQNFAQPSEVTAPTELLRSGVVLHSRGLINSLAIQHNLDWIWPYWIECQYDPRNDAFIPRAFSLTQINLTHRNWTAVGIPDSNEYSIVDGRGLVTPLYDGWSIDAWLIPEKGTPLLPSRLLEVSQHFMSDKNLSIITICQQDQLKLQNKVQMVGTALCPVCQIRISGTMPSAGWLVISLRPYNPEGVSFVHNIKVMADRSSWQVNEKDQIDFDQPPDRNIFSYYHQGDVYTRLSIQDDEPGVFCKVGMATAAALFKLEPELNREVTVSIPLTKNVFVKEKVAEYQENAEEAWDQSLSGMCALQIPDQHFQFLYDTAVRTMILHSPHEVYPGPYIYKRFWFRDAAFILYALLCTGFKRRVARALETFRSRQTPPGYFLSQEGEWDSNGEALWIMRQYCEMTGEAPSPKWKESIYKGGRWIVKKRLSKDLKFVHAGLMPSGFSAEHLGPNDFYFWDDFWSVSGLQAAAYLCEGYHDHNQAVDFENEAYALSDSIDKSLLKAADRIKNESIPASPYRRLDSGAIGSLAASYPLRLLKPHDQRVLGTANFLMENCLVKGGFFHDMTHSGINPYLTLHLAQTFLRAGDPRYFELMTAVADGATSTGQWPEAIHPRTLGGCMGDGQHVWAAAEWALMIRNCFVREEQGRLILCSGIPQTWLDTKTDMIFGPAPTSFGDIKILIKPVGQKIMVEWQGTWFTKEPEMEIYLTGFPKITVPAKTSFYEFDK